MMGSMDLLGRVFLLIAAMLGATLIAEFALVSLFLLGVALAGPVVLALALLTAVVLTVAIGLVFALGASVLAAGVIAFIVFIVMTLTGGPAIALLVTIAFILIFRLVLSLFASQMALSLPMLVAMLFILPLIALVLGLTTLGGALMAFAIAGQLAIGFAFLWLTFRMNRLRLAWIGLGRLPNLPAIPFRVVPDLIDSVVRIGGKLLQLEQSKKSLTNVFTLRAGTADARTADAYAFMYGSEEDKSRSFDDPAQFAMGWTTAFGIDRDAGGLLPGYTAPLMLDAPGAPMAAAAAASTEFWPMFAKHSVAFGILPLARVSPADEVAFKRDPTIAAPWATLTLSAHVSGGTLFVIDLRIFGLTRPPTLSNSRFTPSALMFLTQNQSSAMQTIGAVTYSPVLIQISNGSKAHVYTTPADPVAASAWVYAIHATRVCITVWGIALGHVWRQHLVTAAMQMALFQKMPSSHPVHQVVGRQSKFLISFDVALMLYWTAFAPTSLATAVEFLELNDLFGAGRRFFDDDPLNALVAQGLSAADFSSPLISASEVKLASMAARLKAPMPDRVSASVIAAFSAPAAAGLAAYIAGDNDPLLAAIVGALNVLVTTFDLSTLVVFNPLPPTVQHLVDLGPNRTAVQTATMNRLLLELNYPAELMSMSFNLYPAARYITMIWSACKTYVDGVVAAIYNGSNQAVQDDRPLQDWIAAAANPQGGNVQGLPVPLNTTSELSDILTSLIYRVSVHGILRLLPTANPAMSFTPNFPTCLEDSRIPSPFDPAATGLLIPPPLTNAQLLAFLPKTGTMGAMLDFLFAFAYTDTYESFIPVRGADGNSVPSRDLNPFFGTAVGCDPALQRFRATIIEFIDFFMRDANGLLAAEGAPGFNFQRTPAQIRQWELNIEM
jgi:hypothetical protein